MITTKKDSIQKLVAIATREVGVREGAVNNTGSRVREYQGATWLAPDAWPWCAAFTAWIMREWLKDADVRASLKLASSAFAENWRCKDASAFGWEKWATKRGITLLPESSKARAGDFVVFDFSHIGLVVADQAATNIKTVEGNTNGKGERDSKTGDGVWSKSRAPHLTKSYIRIFSD